MEIFYTSLHRIDHKLDLLEKVDINPQFKDLYEYIKSLIIEITKGDSRMKFNFFSDTTEVRTAIKHLINGSHEIASELASKRLLKIEKDTDKQYGHLKHPIPRGSFFMAYFIDDDGFKKIILLKADHSSYIEEEDLKIHQGLPVDKKIFKALLVELGAKGIENLYVYDNNLAKYWWSDFLELVEERTPAQNTITAFKSIVESVFSKYKKDFPADMNILRNTTIGYFRSNKNFILKDYVKNVIANYEPLSDKLDKKEIITKLNNLPKIKNFDNNFPIRKEEITSRMTTRVINLSDKIELVLKNYIDNLSNEIKSSILGGEKYVLIRSEEGFRQFEEVKFK